MPARSAGMMMSSSRSAMSAAYSRVSDGGVERPLAPRPPDRRAGERRGAERASNDARPSPPQMLLQQRGVGRPTRPVDALEDR